ncbi:Hypothetical protein R9X50_00407300 [Acrodontium crateriforme]|uniref:Uncharacterized protein n=1 Tax=Acrodontium crateriforme TaxID=150365 RepID=A0AAQ3R4S3_9PEZI|nr:Hypothetical protein R9X50_00407300 [Acrodontium crateriforme]
MATNGHGVTEVSISLECTAAAQATVEKAYSTVEELIRIEQSKPLTERQPLLRLEKTPAEVVQAIQMFKTTFDEQNRDTPLSWKLAFVFPGASGKPKNTSDSRAEHEAISERNACSMFQHRHSCWPRAVLESSSHATGLDLGRWSLRDVHFCTKSKLKDRREGTPPGPKMNSISRE